MTRHHKSIRNILDKREREDKEARDIAIKIVASIVPGGTTAYEFVQAIFQPSVTERRDYWTERLAQSIDELIHRVESIEAEYLAQNESFISTALRASEISLRNHQHEKLDALCNAVLHAAFPNAPEDDLQQIYLNLIDRLTVWHLQNLAVIAEHPDGLKAAGIWREKLQSIAPEIEAVNSKLSKHKDLQHQVWRELESMGLVEMSVSEVEGGLPFIVLKITLFGKRFLRFIRKPRVLENAV